MEVEIYNPKNIDEKDLPTIYGFNNGGSPGFMHAQLIAEDGTALGSHLCSSEDYMLGDLGILKGTRSDRHETFREHYPNGYKMEFIGHSTVSNHTELQQALKLNKENNPESKGDAAKVEIIMSK